MRRELRLIAGFLWAVLAYWWAVLVGGILGLLSVLGIAPDWVKHPLTWVVILWLASLVACYLAWRRLRIRLDNRTHLDKALSLKLAALECRNRGSGDIDSATQRVETCVVLVREVNELLMQMDRRGLAHDLPDEQTIRGMGEPGLFELSLTVAKKMDHVYNEISDDRHHC